MNNLVMEIDAELSDPGWSPHSHVGGLLKRSRDAISELSAEVERLRRLMRESAGMAHIALDEVERLRACERDAERLVWFVKAVAVDAIGDTDLHEEASINASAFGRDEPNDDDYIAALRTAIDIAREAKP